MSRPIRSSHMAAQGYRGASSASGVGRSALDTQLLLKTGTSAASGTLSSTHRRAQRVQGKTPDLVLAYFEEYDRLAMLYESSRGSRESPSPSRDDALETMDYITVPSGAVKEMAATVMGLPGAKHRYCARSVAGEFLKPPITVDIPPSGCRMWIRSFLAKMVLRRCNRTGWRIEPVALDALQRRARPSSSSQLCPAVRLRRGRGAGAAADRRRRRRRRILTIVGPRARQEPLLNIVADSKRRHRR